MKKENMFYAIFVVTIVLTRFFVYLFPARKLLIAGTLIHHFWVGVAFVIFAVVIFKKHNVIRLVFLALGVAWISDELIYMLLGAGPVTNYWSPYSIVGMLVCVAIVIFTGSKIIKKV